MNKVIISASQLKLLVIMYTIGATILIMPSSMAVVAKQDAWLVPLVSMPAGLFMIWLYITVGNLNPDSPLAESMDLLLGKNLSTITLLLFAVFSLLGAATLIWDVGNFISNQFMPETPTVYVKVLFTAVVIYGIRLGLEPVARSAEMVFPWVIALFCFTIILIIPEAKTENLQPVLENGLKPVCKAALLLTSILTFPLVVLLNFFPACVSQPKKRNQAFITGYLIASCIVFLIIIFSILVLGHEITAMAQFPSYILAKKIHVGQILERIEGIIALIWLITMMYRTMLYTYAVVFLFAHIFQLQDYRFITLPLVLILVSLSVIVYPDQQYASEWNATTWVPFAATFGFLLPIVLLAAAYIKKKKQQAS